VHRIQVAPKMASSSQLSRPVVRLAPTLLASGITSERLVQREHEMDDVSLSNYVTLLSGSARSARRGRWRPVPLSDE
jgi:hypothetical protein